MDDETLAELTRLTAPGYVLGYDDADKVIQEVPNLLSEIRSLRATLLDREEDLADTGIALNAFRRRAWRKEDRLDAILTAANDYLDSLDEHISQEDFAKALYHIMNLSTGDYSDPK